LVEYWNFATATSSVAESVIMTEPCGGVPAVVVYQPLLPFATGPVLGGLTYDGGDAGVVATLSTGGVVSVP
jgi:hypothetical protein